MLDMMMLDVLSTMAQPRREPQQLELDLPTVELCVCGEDISNCEDAYEHMTHGV